MTDQNKKFLGKTVLITGSGQNIGREIALAFAKQGANIVINGKTNFDALQEVAGLIEAVGVKVLPVLSDISVPQNVKELIKKTIDRFDSIDIFIANAAIRRRQKLLEITQKDWEQIIATNLSSPFYTAQAIIPYMKKQRLGRIIHISGIDGFLGRPNFSHNIVSKSGLHGLTKAIASEYGEYGITANTVVPGWIDTKRDLTNYPDLQEKYQFLRENLPVRRIGKTLDVANACLFLTQEESDYITGQTIHVNGGEYMS